MSAPEMDQPIVTGLEHQTIFRFADVEHVDRFNGLDLLVLCLRCARAHAGHVVRFDSHEIVDVLVLCRVRHL